MSTGIKRVGGDLKRLKDMIDRSKNASGALARLFKLYQRLQVERFKTQNASEGSRWDPLNQKYEKYKTVRYGGGPRRSSKAREDWARGSPQAAAASANWASYPFQGALMLVGTGMLAGAVIGRSQGSPFVSGTDQNRTMFTASKMIVSVSESGTNPDGTDFNYAHFVSEHRPFMTFGPESHALFVAEVKKYLNFGGS